MSRGVVIGSGYCGAVTISGGRRGVWARFDDHTTGVALEFTEVDHVLVARQPHEVPKILDRVDALSEEGWWAAGYVAYEAAGGLDSALPTTDPAPGLPLVWFAIFREPKRIALHDTVVDSEAPAPPVAPDAPADDTVGPWALEWDSARHRDAVATVREEIAAGHTYQCNLTTRMTAPAPGDEYRFHRDLIARQGGAYNAFLDTGRFVVASASPELFFEQAGDRILMSPMKGTAARGRTTAEDDHVAAELALSAKERAENVMIVDLVRNDLGRIAVPGSVTVPRLLRVERFETVLQLTSDVEATLRSGVGLGEIFRALFPCGSVTGAPKVSTMKLIDRLESGPRGIYCGAVGFVTPPGEKVRARFSVAIRTVLIDRDAGRAMYGTGGGITWESEAGAEFAELEAKSRILEPRPRDFYLIETMRHVADDGLRSLDAHLARMADSATYFGFPFDEHAARDLLDARLESSGDARVRLTCDRGGRLGVTISPFPEASAPEASAPEASVPGSSRAPLRLAIDEAPVDSNECWPHHKTSRRQPYESRRARHPHFDEVLLVNERGEVTEACTANVAARIDGQWWTPPLGDGCLPGIERGRLVAARQLTERVLRPDDLWRADGLALVNSLRGWRPAILG